MMHVCMSVYSVCPVHVRVWLSVVCLLCGSSVALLFCFRHMSFVVSFARLCASLHGIKCSEQVHACTCTCAHYTAVHNYYIDSLR